MKNKNTRDYNNQKSPLNAVCVSEATSIPRVYNTESVSRVEFLEKLLNLKLKIEQERTKRAKIMANLKENLSTTREISNQLNSIINEKSCKRDKVLDECINGFRKLIQENNTESLKEIVNGMIKIVSSPVITHQEVEAVSSTLTGNKSSQHRSRKEVIDVKPEKITIVD